MSQARTPSSNKLRTQSVLVIDDSDLDRQLTADILGAGGFTVYQLPSPIGATRAARDLHVGAVVIDQNQPSMDGSKLAALFRSTGLTDLRVILISGSERGDMAEVARVAGADAFVAKQRLREELLPTVRRLLSK